MRHVFSAGSVPAPPRGVCQAPFARSLIAPPGFKPGDTSCGLCAIRTAVALPTITMRANHDPFATTGTDEGPAAVRMVRVRLLKINIWTVTRICAILVGHPMLVGMEGKGVGRTWKLLPTPLFALCGETILYLSLALLSPPSDYSPLKQISFDGTHKAALGPPSGRG